MPEHFTPHGVYRTSSDIIEVSGTWEQLLELRKWKERRGSLKEPTDAHLRAYFTEAHEHMHRVDVMTTPFGLLLWRIDVAITIDARALVPQFGHPPVGTPLVEHCRGTSLGVPVGLDEVRTHRMVRCTVEELDRLVRFRDYLWSGAPPGLTCAQLADEGNEVLDILRKRFDLETTWRFTTINSDAPAAVSVPHRCSFGTVDILERSAMIWERLWVLTTVEKRWPAAVQWWLDWRNARMRYRDMGDLNDLVNMEAHKRLALFALSGPCDPALDLDANVPIEAALPTMRWDASRAAAADPQRRSDRLESPIAGTLDTVQVYEMLAGATLNGRYGLFGNAERAGNGARAADPRYSYLAFVLRRFQDEFAQRSRVEAGLGSVRNVPRVNPLVSLFDDVCVVHLTEVIGVDIRKVESGHLLLSLLMEYIHQELAKHNVCGETPDAERLWLRLRPMACRLVTDFHDDLPTRTEDPDELLGLAFLSYAASTYGPGSAR
ncbi:hypothetical protein FBY35_0089 [Streptomyces sp. SLBN-118]|uniref:hypothetical protein n=1 Tax=Streptomyces sp. SLBN-118 TaxID=2768454 RepID=UPI0011532D43|nr:hypothetical protein [Streptomyces sp. SLBN-118]TQK49819.1 hypothetical protein FBY35_0089 [Streptomyces sp. SLBN-118]